MIRIQISDERYDALRSGLLADYHRHGRIRTTNELRRLIGPVTTAEIALAAARLRSEGMLRQLSESCIKFDIGSSQPDRRK